MKDFKQLSQALKDAYFDKLIVAVSAGKVSDITEPPWSDVKEVPTAKRDLVIQAFYMKTKTLLARRELRSARQFLKWASLIAPETELLQTRMKLLEKALTRDGIRSTVDVHDLQRNLQLLCHKKQCVCASPLEVAECKGLIDPLFHFEAKIDGIPVYTLGSYYAWSYKGQWTKLLKQIKHFPYDLTRLPWMAAIAADFVIKRTAAVANIDAVIPIPSSTVKVVDRGFAPTEILADHLGTRLVVPAIRSLRRSAGTPTREASLAELRAQFQIETSQRDRLKGLSILLVEDIWTTGRTIRVCTEKLAAIGVGSIFVITLAKTA